MTKAPPSAPATSACGRAGLVLAPGLRWRAWEDGGVVYMEPSGDTLLLDPAATLVLEAVAGGVRDAATVKAVLAAAAPGIGRDRLDAWVDDLLERLLRDGLLTVDAAGAGNSEAAP